MVTNKHQDLIERYGMMTAKELSALRGLSLNSAQVTLLRAERQGLVLRHPFNGKETYATTGQALRREALENAYAVLLDCAERSATKLTAQEVKRCFGWIPERVPVMLSEGDIALAVVDHGSDVCYLLRRVQRLCERLSLFEDYLKWLEAKRLSIRVLSSSRANAHSLAREVEKLGLPVPIVPVYHVAYGHLVERKNGHA